MTLSIFSIWISILLWVNTIDNTNISTGGATKAMGPDPK